MVSALLSRSSALAARSMRAQAPRGTRALHVENTAETVSLWFLACCGCLLGPGCMREGGQDRKEIQSSGRERQVESAAWLA